MAPFGHAPPPPASSSQEQPEREKFEVIPMNADKPSGLDMGDFLPDRFRFESLTRPGPKIPAVGHLEGGSLFFENIFGLLFQ